MNSQKPYSTPQALALCQALERHGINIELEHWDGHKHIDIYIPKAKIYIEVDGLQHLTNSDQMLADFKREFYSTKEGFYTLHIPNGVLMKDLDQIADAIAILVKEDQQDS